MMSSVVVADSCPLTRAILIRFLSDAGIRATPAATARDVVNKLTSSSDVGVLVLDTDCAMCGGLGLVRYLRKLPVGKRLAVLALAYTRTRDQITSLVSGGIDALVLKEELSRATLVKRVQQILHGPVAKSDAAVPPEPTTPATVSSSLQPAVAPASVEAPAPATPTPTLERLTPDQIDQAIISVATARPMKPIVHQVIVLTNDPRSELADLVRVIRNDLTLTAKIIGTANSSFYRRGSDVNTLAEAISVMGLKVTRELAVSLTVVDEMKDATLDPAIALPNLWGHSLATSHLAEFIANHTKLCDCGQAFIVGLLHDYGRRLMAWQVPDHYRAVMASLSDARDEPLVDVERRIVGMDHALIAGRVMERWGCPQFMTRSVSLHHSDALWGPSFDDPMSGLLRTLRLADGLASAFGFEAHEQDSLSDIAPAWLSATFAEPEKIVREMHGSLLERIGLMLSRASQDIHLPAPWNGALDQIILLGARPMPLEPLQAMLQTAYPSARIVGPGKAAAAARTLVLADLRHLDPATALSKLDWLTNAGVSSWRLLVVGMPGDIPGNPVRHPVERTCHLPRRVRVGAVRKAVESLLD